MRVRVTPSYAEFERPNPAGMGFLVAYVVPRDHQSIWVQASVAGFYDILLRALSGLDPGKAPSLFNLLAERLPLFREALTNGARDKHSPGSLWVVTDPDIESPVLAVRTIVGNLDFQSLAVKTRLAGTDFGARLDEAMAQTWTICDQLVTELQTARFDQSNLQWLGDKIAGDGFKPNALAFFLNTHKAIGLLKL